MKAKYAEPTNDPDINVTMKESEAVAVKEVIGNMGRDEIMKASKCTEEEANTVVSIYHALYSFFD